MCVCIEIGTLSIRDVLGKHQLLELETGAETVE